MATAEKEKNKGNLEKMLLSLVVVVILALASGWSFMQFTTIQQIVSGEYEKMPPLPPVVMDENAMKEKDDVAQTEKQLSSVEEAKRQAMMSAQLAESTGVFPIAKAETLLGATALQPLSPTGEVVLEELPPAVTVRAIMSLNNVTLATVDIENEEPGKIIRVGSTFDGGRGVITSIKTGGIKYRWKKKTHEVQLNP